MANITNTQTPAEQRARLELASKDHIIDLLIQQRAKTNAKGQENWELIRENRRITKRLDHLANKFGPMLDNQFLSDAAIGWYSGSKHEQDYFDEYGVPCPHGPDCNPYFNTTVDEFIDRAFGLDDDEEDEDERETA